MQEAFKKFGVGVIKELFFIEFFLSATNPKWPSFVLWALVAGMETLHASILR